MIHPDLEPNGDILFFDSGGIKKIYLDKEKSWPFEYCIKIVGACPSNASYIGFTFFDQNEEKYRIDIVSTSEKIHTLRYNSQKPIIPYVYFKYY